MLMIMISVSDEITAWKITILEKLIFAKMVKKRSAFYRARKLIAVFTYPSAGPYLVLTE
jgi:hypothetical protein